MICTSPEADLSQNIIAFERGVPLSLGGSSTVNISHYCWMLRWKVGCSDKL